MTVCIAAICDVFGSPGIIAASDRMLTAGDIEYERPAAKVFQFSPLIMALIAGNAGAQDDICRFAKSRIGEEFTVDEAVDAYCREVSAYHLRAAEQEVLAPYGMTMSSFISQQKQLGSNFANQLLREIGAVIDDLRIETIIAGVDESGPHIYSIDHKGNRLCNDSAGFAAIGIGGRHAESQFMFQRYAPHWTLGPALLLLYTAKRRSEVAPGVGRDIDMFFLRSTATSNVIPKPVVDFLAERHAGRRASACLDGRRLGNSSRRADVP